MIRTRTATGHRDAFSNKGIVGNTAIQEHGWKGGGEDEEEEKDVSDTYGDWTYRRFQQQGHRGKNGDPRTRLDWRRRRRGGGEG